MSEVMKAFLSLMHAAHFDAKKAHGYSFDDAELGRKENKCAALAYACSCIARVSAAKAILWCNIDELHRTDLDELLAQFDTFTEEVMEDFSTDHSRQWVDIEFNRLEELFNGSVCNQPISE